MGIFGFSIGLISHLFPKSIRVKKAIKRSVKSVLICGQKILPQIAQTYIDNLSKLKKQNSSNFFFLILQHEQRKSATI